MHPQDFIFIFHGFLLFLVHGSSASHQRRGLGAGVSQVIDFDCPEEFGYYPHPTDCTQYYVCVFGGALLESCTGGLMYSHELQTCDWPRNVGCSESGGSDGGTISTVRVTDPRTRAPQNSRTSSSPQQQSNSQGQSSRNRQQEYNNRVRQPEVIQQQLYAEEDLGPAEEVENDRQQRVYRGQPSTVGQVQRDRDGLRPLKNSVHSQNVIPTGPGTQDKISVVSFGSQRPSAPRPQEQYRVEQVQNYQVTSALPPLSPSPRPVERFNTSQRYQPNQYDPYYAVYDDGDIYRSNDYSQQQQYQTPSSTPSSNIAQQYRGQTTYKQQNLEIEQQEEPQQQHRNVYNQDLYSPSPALQDYNDQYNVQIDDQQYQQIAQPTPKAPSRSESTNSSKDALPEPSLVVNSRISNNTTPKTDTVPITKRSDNYNPSSILVPPPKSPQQDQRDLETSLTPPRNEKAYYLESFPQFRSSFPVVSNRNNLVPPRNGGSLAKSLNNFDSILANFFTSVTSGNERLNEKASPETIVRSEIGRIQHEPIVIRDDYNKKQEAEKKQDTSKEVTSESVPNDYLAYFVEIEPKKPKAKEPTRGFLLAKQENESKEEKIITKDTLQAGDNDEVGFNIRDKPRQANSFVRVTPKEEVRNIKLSAAIPIEPIQKPEDKRRDEDPENETVEIEKDSSEDIRPLPLHGDNSGEIRGRSRYQVTRPQVVREEYFATSQDRHPRVKQENDHKKFDSSEERHRTRGRRPEESSEELKIIKNPNPYKFVVVNLESHTTEKHLSTPAPFSRNPENEERNQQLKNTTLNYKNRYVPERFDSSEDVRTSPPIRAEEASGIYLPEHPTNVNIEPTTRKPPIRIRTTSEQPTTEAEEPKKPRRVVKIHRSDLRNQRLNLPKVKRIRKPSTQTPVENLEDISFTKENEIHSTFRPIIVHDDLEGTRNKTRFRFTIEDTKDFTLLPDGKLGLFVSTTEPYETNIDTIPRGFEKANVRPAFVPINPAVGNSTTEPSTEKTLILIPTRAQTYKNNTEHENRATVKPYRRKFKPTDSSKLRLRPTTASPDSETTPGPHLPTRQPSNSYSTGNEVNSNRGTPATNRGVRPGLVKPSLSLVAKPSEPVDIYRFPPRRPENLYATPTPDKSAAKCRKDVCLLPDCSCGGKDIPGGYSAEEIPQLVLLTFDDSVNDLNKGLYSDLFERGRVNPNGCPISATFYVSHEWTDYSQVQNLYHNGHEIASHSITHSFGEQFSQKKWTKEIAGQREILSAYGGVRLEDIRGMRAPFLAVGGNKMFKMLYDSNFTYDSSMPIYENRPPSWPYTLDYKLFHDCMIPPCPTKSYPGVWEVPMVMWQDLNGGRCSMGDACSNPPTADGVYKMLIKNFERHFTTNRAPFGLYYHAAWFTHEHHKEGFIAFLDTIVNMPEVWLVTSWQAIQWVRDPQPLNTVENFPPFQCNVEKAKKCNNPKVCNLWHKSGVRYMRTCQPCPDVYPWTGKTGVRNSRVDNEIIEE